MDKVPLCFDEAQSLYTLISRSIHVQSSDCQADDKVEGKLGLVLQIYLFLRGIFSSPFKVII